MARATLGRVQPPHDMVDHRRFPHTARAIDQEIGTAGGLPDRVQHLVLDLVEAGMPGRKGFELVEAGPGGLGHGALRALTGPCLPPRKSSYTRQGARATGGAPASPA